MRVGIIGDPHMPGMLSRYPQFCAKVFKKYRVNCVVCIGDAFDYHALSYHEKHYGMPSLETEVKNATKQARKLHKLFPRAHWLIGNHDALPSRKASDAGLLPDMLMDPVKYWGLDGWTLHERYSWLEIDNVLYSHGEVGKGGSSNTPALVKAMEQFRSVVIGHFHGVFGVQWTANQRDCVFGMSVGTGMDHEYLGARYGRKFSRKPIVGCGVVIDGVEAHCHRMRL